MDRFDRAARITEKDSAEARERFDDLAGAALLDSLARFLHRFVHMPAHLADIIALWIVHTHVFDVFDITPYLNIRSPEKRSGKTTLLKLLKLLCARAWLTGRISAAVLVRKIDKERPTLLLDEADAAFNGTREFTEAVRAIFDFGNERGGQASICIKAGGDWGYKDFEAFCPKAFAGIGRRMPDTVEDRSIPIDLKRCSPDESVEKFRRRKVRAEAERIQELIALWASSFREALAQAEPEIPDLNNDRAEDIIEPLLAIADAAGAGWPARAREAVQKVFPGNETADDSVGVRLLADIWSVYNQECTDKMASQTLCERLEKIETSPWAELRKGRPLNPIGLARLLKPYKIRPDGVRIGDKTPNGYTVYQFADAWRRYCPGLGDPLKRESDPPHTPQPNENGPDGPASETPQTAPVEGRGGDETSIKTDLVDAVDPDTQVEDVSNTSNFSEFRHRPCRRHGVRACVVCPELDAAGFDDSKLAGVRWPGESCGFFVGANVTAECARCGRDSETHAVSP